MKFLNGCWLWKEGTAGFSPAEAYEVDIRKDEVYILAPTHHINHKGDTLGGINLSIRITTPFPEVIRVEAYHFKGKKDNGPQFDISIPQREIKAKESDGLLTIESGSLRLVIDENTWSMAYFRGNDLLTKSTGRDFAYIKTDWKGDAYNKNDKDAFFRQQLDLRVGELVYGLGEHFGPFVKNGQSIDMWNEDGGTSTDQSYKNIPFYLTNRGYGVFVNHPEKVSFEVATEQVSKVAFSVPGERIDYFVINGPTMKDVISRYTDITGKPALTPQWTFGLWLSTSFTTNYDEKTVMSFVDGMEERGIPLSVFHFDCCWMREFHWTDFIWDKRVFPDPKGLLKRMHEKGLKICVWINSYIAQESALFDEGMEKGYFLKTKEGDVWQWDMWQPGMALVDFTNPDAKKWFQSGLKKLLDMGVDCFKTDFGERIPVDNVRWFSGADPEKMHNYYTYLYNQAVYELLVEERGENEAVLFARSATAGGQKFPVHWGGDCWSSYESMAESLRGGLSLTSSGFGYWSHDIGGFEDASTPDVYKRWAAFGLLSSHSRLHGSTSYRVPWVYDEEAVDVVRFFSKLKCRLIPYLYSQAVNTSVSGIPMTRSMALEFSSDRNALYLDRQYMLGDSLLVAPIFRDDGIAEYYLPKGIWTNMLTGEVRKISECGCWFSEKHSYLSIPLWVRENSIVAISPDQKRAGDSYREGICFNVYSLHENAETTVFENGEKVCKLKLERKENRVKYICEAAVDAAYKINFVNEGKEVEIISGEDIIEL
ncbi:alpha-D-xyloside xylohydrolase [Lachnospiraceae bacterium KH1T2]|nr:alpha-D-xyloside xylohydrolase [Lachnospiraceae bacterium KH1T2]